MINNSSRNEAFSWSKTDQMDAVSDSSVLCEVQLLTSSHLQEMYNFYFLNVEYGPHKLHESYIQIPTVCLHKRLYRALHSEPIFDKM